MVGPALDIPAPPAPTSRLLFRSTAASGVLTSRHVQVLTSIKQRTSAPQPIRSISPRQRGERNLRAPITQPSLGSRKYAYSCPCVPLRRYHGPLMCRQEPFGSTSQPLNPRADEARSKRTIGLIQAEPISASRDVISLHRPTRLRSLLSRVGKPTTASPQEKTSPRTRPRAWSLPPFPQRRQQRIKFLEMRSAPSRALRTFSTVLP
jgi:hypothetical protein